VVKDGGKYGRKWSLKYEEMKSSGGITGKHLELTEFLKREK